LLKTEPNTKSQWSVEKRNCH